MARFIPLDAGVVGLLICSPTVSGFRECFEWVGRMNDDGARVVIPDITLYEVHRGLLKKGAEAKKGRLAQLRDVLGPVPIIQEDWLLAGEFWAGVHRAGKPTADPKALDGDSILAAVAVRLAKGGNSATIATANVGHLSRFPGVDARRWQEIGVSTEPIKPPFFVKPQRIPAPPGDIVRGLVTYQDDIRAFRISTGNGDDTYDIEADRILTHKAFTDWVWQLQAKGWVTGQHLGDLFDCLSEFIYRQWGDWPQTFYGVENSMSVGPDKV